MSSIPVGPPKLTRFEKARIVGARALQITLGAPLLVEPSKEDTRKPIDIAIAELESGVLPVSIRRRLPDGSIVDIAMLEFFKQKRKR
ncbi:MAG: DNA-directed RNA polymerase subunit K [Candidatus Bathyarchaeia archaeon]